MANAPANGNGYARFGTVATTIAACLGAVGTIAVAIWFAISIAMAPLQKQLDSQADAIKEIRGELVPREEHMRYDEIQKARFDDLQRQVTKATDDLKAIYGPSDALRRLQDQIDRLQDDERQKRK